MFKQYCQYITVLLCLIMTQGAYADLSRGGNNGIKLNTNSSRGGAANTSPITLAIKHYNSGLKQRDKGLALKAQASSIDDATDSERLLKKANRRFQAAINFYNKSIKLVDGFHQAYTGIGFALYQQGKLGDAVTAYEQALAIKADYPQAIIQLADVHLALKEFDKVKAAYEQLKQHYPAEFATALLSNIKAWSLQPANLVSNDSATQAFQQWVKTNKLAAN